MVSTAPPLEVALDVNPELGLALALDTVEEWGGEVDETGDSRRRGPTRVRVPVRAGLRYGFVDGHLGTEPNGDGSRLVLHVDEVHYRLHVSAVVVMLLGGIAGLSMLVMPLYPQLLGLLPLAGLLLLLAWFLVASQLKHRSATDLLGEVASRASAAQLEGEDPSAPE